MTNSPTAEPTHPASGQLDSAEAKPTQRRKTWQAAGSDRRWVAASPRHIEHAYPRSLHHALNQPVKIVSLHPILTPALRFLTAGQ